MSSMRGDRIRQSLPDVDPDFVHILERLPDPAPKFFKTVMQYLPRLHSLFLRKREAAAKGDASAFLALVEEEVSLLRVAERDFLKKGVTQAR